MEHVASGIWESWEKAVGMVGRARLWGQRGLSFHPGSKEQGGWVSGFSHLWHGDNNGLLGCYGKWWWLQTMYTVGTQQIILGRQDACDICKQRRSLRWACCRGLKAQWDIPKAAWRVSGGGEKGSSQRQPRSHLFRSRQGLESGRTGRPADSWEFSWQNTKFQA